MRSSSVRRSQERAIEFHEMAHHLDVHRSKAGQSLGKNAVRRCGVERPTFSKNSLTVLVVICP
jgi:hypothetical protein